MAGVDDFTLLSSTTVARGAGLLGIEVISDWVFHKYSLGGDTTTPTNTLGFVTHFLFFSPRQVLLTIVNLSQ